MRVLKAVVCVLLALSLVGCAMSTNPNPMIRYGVNTGVALAGPGLVALCVGGAVAEETGSDSEWGELAFWGIAAAAGGFVVGAVLGGTVGFFKWMFNGFKDDNVDSAYDLPEEIMPPAE
jgi:hypothetical protein